jgi:carbonyl reductase 1
LSKEAREVINVNYTATKNLCDVLFPLLRPHARVVNVSSSLGKAGFIVDKVMHKRLLSDDLTGQEIESFIDQYLKFELVTLI